MAPIVSPKLLSQVMMHGCTVELSKATYVKVLYADLKARPVAVCRPTVIILGSVLPRQRRKLAPSSNEVSCTSLPNSTLVMDPEDSCPEAYLTGEAGSLVPVPEVASFSAVGSDSEKLEQMEQVASGSTGSLEVCPEFGSVATRGSSVLSITPSNSSVTSCEPPLTAATSIPPWEASQPSGGPPLKFGASPIAGYARSCHTVDSLDIARCRRASEATRAGPSNVFAPRACKYSAIRGLRNLGLRGLELFKKVKW